MSWDKAILRATNALEKNRRLLDQAPRGLASNSTLSNRNFQVDPQGGEQAPKQRVSRKTKKRR